MNSADLLTEATCRRVESERHRLAYAYHLTWLTHALRMPAAWQEAHHGEVLEAARLCRDERAAATGASIAEADGQWGTVFERARDIAETPPGPFASVDELAAALGATVVGGGDGE